MMRKSGYAAATPLARKQPERTVLPPMLTPAAAAQIAIVSERSILELCRAGELPAVKVGKCWRLPTPAFLREMGLDGAYVVKAPDADAASRLAMS